MRGSAVLGTRMAVFIVLGAPFLYGFPGVCRAQNEQGAVGSKIVTESVILGEIARRLLVHEGIAAEHCSELGGRKYVWQALLSGTIDLYPDYTGTLIEETLVGEVIGIHDLPVALARYRLRMTAPLGSNDTHVLGMANSWLQRLACVPFQI